MVFDTGARIAGALILKSGAGRDYFKPERPFEFYCGFPGFIFPGGWPPRIALRKIEMNVGQGFSPAVKVIRAQT